MREEIIAVNVKLQSTRICFVKPYTR